MPLTVLFAVLASALAAIGAYSLASGTGGRHLLIGIAAAAVAVWFVTLSRAAFRRRR